MSDEEVRAELALISKRCESYRLQCIQLKKDLAACESSSKTKQSQSLGNANRSHAANLKKRDEHIANLEAHLEASQQDGATLREENITLLSDLKHAQDDVKQRGKDVMMLKSLNVRLLNDRSDLVTRGDEMKKDHDSLVMRFENVMTALGIMESKLRAQDKELEMLHAMKNDK